MLYRRHTSDVAIGWISTVDSLLLGFGLMVVLSLHMAMTRRDVQAIADRTAKSLEHAKQALSDLQLKERESQEQIAALKTVQRDDLVDQSRRLQQQRDVKAQGAEAITVKLDLALRERDSLKKQQSKSEQQLAVVRGELEDTKRNLAGASAAATKTQKERDALEIRIKDLQAQLLTLKDRQVKADMNTIALAQEAERLRTEAAGTAREYGKLKLAMEGKDRDLSRLKMEAAEAEKAKGIAENRIRQEAIAGGQAAASDVLGFKGRFKNVVFIIDISHSMTHVTDPARPGHQNADFRPERWNKTKQEILTWAGNLPMKTLRVVLFHTKVTAHPGKGEFYPMEGADRSRSVAAIETVLKKVTPDLATNTLDALAEAYKYPGVDTMILFTDGRPQVKGRKTDDVIADVQRLVRQHPNIPVNVVGIGEYFEKSFADFLRDIAGTTGGEFIGR
jgi:hypothetical protein